MGTQMDSDQEKKRTVIDLWPGDRVIARPPGSLFGHQCRVIDVKEVLHDDGEPLVVIDLSGPTGTKFTVAAILGWGHEV